jgi:hypothetical protein
LLERPLCGDTVENYVFDAAPKFAGPWARDSKKIRGNAEVDIEVAGDQRSRIAVPLHAYFSLTMSFGRIFTARQIWSFSTVSKNSARGAGQLLTHSTRSCPSR